MKKYIIPQVVLSSVSAEDVIATSLVEYGNDLPTLWEPDEI